MRQTFLPLLAVLACQTALAASDGQKQADDFTKLYSSTCFAYLPELDKLTEKLADFPPVPEEDAQNFLRGYNGKAWIVPHEPENYVIAVMPEHEHCALYAYHADAARVEKQYLDFVKKPPEGFTAERTTPSTASKPTPLPTSGKHPTAKTNRPSCSPLPPTRRAASRR